jgi:hypothetical protein
LVPQPLHVDATVGPTRSPHCPEGGAASGVAGGVVDDGGPHGSPSGRHACVSVPSTVVAVTHEWPAPHVSPFAHEGAQKESPSNCAHTEFWVQSSFVTHGVQPAGNVPASGSVIVGFGLTALEDDEHAPTPRNPAANAATNQAARPSIAEVRVDLWLARSTEAKRSYFAFTTTLSTKISPVA